MVNHYELSGLHTVYNKWRDGEGYKLTGFDIIMDGLVEELCVFPEILAQQS